MIWPEIVACPENVTFSLPLFMVSLMGTVLGASSTVVIPGLAAGAAAAGVLGSEAALASEPTLAAATAANATRRKFLTGGRAFMN
jgi:hypothetical protein